MRRTFLTLALAGGLGLGAAVLPGTAALAASGNCAGGGDGGFGIHFGFGVHFGEPYTEEEEMQFAEMRLRAKGYDVIRTEKYGSSCVRAFIRNPSGYGTHMEFFDAETLEPADDSTGGGGITFNIGN